MVDKEFARLRVRLIQEAVLPPQSVHGPAHWNRVKEIGLRLAKSSGADPLVVRLFSIFHDCRRESNSADPGHGPRGAARARELCGVAFELDEERLRLLCEACEGHTSGDRHPDPTIGTCWDSDRLDLPRVGIIPVPHLLSTRAARDPKMIKWATQLSRPGWKG
jgi:uncharacterized protein